MNARYLMAAGAATLALASIASPASAAGFLGSSVTLTEFYPDHSTIYTGEGGTSPYTTPVTNAAEFPSGSVLPGRGLAFDITDNSIHYTSNETVNYSPATFSGFDFVFSGAPTITNVTLNPASTLALYDLTFTGNKISFNVAGLSVNNDSFADLDVAFAVPEPASWAMMLGGFGVVGGTLRSRRKVVARLANA